MSDWRVLITGGDGQLATDLKLLLAQQAEVYAPGRAELDITDDTRVEGVFSDFGPTLVVNCAAFHNVEVCESQEDRAFAVNGRAVARLARRCAEPGAKLVHLSTNYVFDGTASDAYPEDAMPAPRSIYAVSKLAGEYAAMTYASDALVVRTAGLYGMHGSASKGGNFVVRMLARAQEHGALKVVADQLLTPTFTADLASGILSAVEAGMSGTLHLTNAGATSWHGFTEAIMGLAGVEVPVEAIATTRAPDAAQRPRNGVLRSTVAGAAGLAPLRPWREALADYLRLAELLAADDGLAPAVDLFTRPLIGT